MFELISQEILYLRSCESALAPDETVKHHHSGSLTVELSESETQESAKSAAGPSDSLLPEPGRNPHRLSQKSHIIYH